MYTSFDRKKSQSSVPRRKAPRCVESLNVSVLSAHLTSNGNEFHMFVVKFPEILILIYFGGQFWKI
jgi:hypothetical protein